MILVGLFCQGFGSQCSSVPITFYCWLYILINLCVFSNVFGFCFCFVMVLDVFLWLITHYWPTKEIKWHVESFIQIITIYRLTHTLWNRFRLIEQQVYFGIKFEKYITQVFLSLVKYTFYVSKNVIYIIIQIIKAWKSYYIVQFLIFILPLQDVHLVNAIVIAIVSKYV